MILQTRSHKTQIKPTTGRPHEAVYRLVCVHTLVLLCAFPAVANPNLVTCGDFEGGEAAAVAAGWQVGGAVRVVAGAVGESTHLRVDCPTNPEAGTAALFTGLKLKPRTGYVARYRMRGDGAAHHTFALINPQNSVFLVCRDAYAMSTWNECFLAFRTGDETELNLYLGRRYGTGAILYDDVSLVEDDTVRIGDLSPAPHPLPPVTTAESRLGYLLSAQHWMEHVYPTYLPRRSEVITSLHCRLAPGEYEPVTLSVTALRPLANVSLALAGDLKGPGGATLPATDVQVGVVRTMTRWFNNSAPLKPGQSFERRPMFIFPQSQVAIAEKETQRFWLTVHAAAALRPGKYRTLVRVSATGAEVVSLPLVVEVLPLQLPEPEVTYGMYYRQCCQYPEFRTEAYFRRSMADMRAHGCNSMSVYANIERRLPDGTLQADFNLTGPGHGLGENHPAFNWQMAILGETGLLQPNHPLLFLATGTSNGVFGNQEQTVAAARELTRQKGWPELLWYLVDEPAADQRELIHGLADVIHRVPGARTVTAGVGGGELGQYYDVWIQGEADNMYRVVTDARKQGKQAWAYNCNWNGAQPLNDRYYTGYFTWITGITGNWQWCYSESSGARITPMGEVDYGDVTYYEDPHRNCYILPGPDYNVPTLGWEARREGIDDYRYLQALRVALQAAESKPEAKQRDLIREARRFLQQLARETRRPPQQLPATQTARVYDHVLHPGLSPARYDILRTRAADLVCQLQKP